MNRQQTLVNARVAKCKEVRGAGEENRPVEYVKTRADHHHEAADHGCAEMYKLRPEGMPQGRECAEMHEFRLGVYFFDGDFCLAERKETTCGKTSFAIQILLSFIL